MRKAGKRLRYAAEVSEPGAGEARRSGWSRRSRRSRSCWASTRTPYVARGLLRELGPPRPTEGGERLRVRLAAARRAGPRRGRGGRRRRRLEAGAAPGGGGDRLTGRST